MKVYIQLQPPNPDDKDLFFYQGDVTTDSQAKNEILRLMIETKKRGIRKKHNDYEFYILRNKVLIHIVPVTKDLHGRNLFLQVCIVGYNKEEEETLINYLNIASRLSKIDFRAGQLNSIIAFLNSLKKKIILSIILFAIIIFLISLLWKIII